jgi:hypothetical protein
MSIETRGRYRIFPSDQTRLKRNGKQADITCLADVRTPVGICLTIAVKGLWLNYNIV